MNPNLMPAAAESAAPETPETLPRFDDVRALLEAWRPREPVYCLYPEVLAGVARRFLAGFPGRVLYAVKANPDPRVLACLVGAGVRHFDTASLPEIALVKGLFPEAACYFMAPSRLLGAAAEAAGRYGVRHFVVDHPNALALLLEETAGAGIDPRELTVFVRLAAKVGGAMYEFSSKFGATPAMTVELLKQVAAAGAEPALAFNVGSMVMQPAAYAEGLALCRGVLEDSGLRLRLLDLGGGFPTPYPGLPVPPLGDFFAAIAQARAALPLADDAELLGEPGRALVAEGMSLLTQVILRKEDGVYLNDGVYGSLGEPGFSKGEVHFPTRAYRLKGPLANEARPLKLFGPTCDSGDALPRPFELPADLAPGDWVEFGLMGAYTIACRTAFNGFYPDTMAEIGGEGARPPGV